MLTEKLHAGAFIVQEMPGYYSRDELTVALNQTIDAGQVCGVVTASGEVKDLDPAAEDGSEVAKVIAVYPMTTGAASGGMRHLTFITRDAEVRASDLTWPEGITAGEKAAAIDELRGVGIILR